MVRFRSMRFLLPAGVIAALVVFLLPAFAAYRYTAPQQHDQFVTHPWRGWSFAWAAVRVPADSALKTSGMALRKATWIFSGTAVDPREVQLLFVPSDTTYAFTNSIDGRQATNTVVPSYRFIWQVQGAVNTISDRGDTIVALLDYASGRVLYDVRSDLRQDEVEPEPSRSPQPTPTSASPSATASP